MQWCITKITAWISLNILRQALTCLLCHTYVGNRSPIFQGDCPSKTSIFSKTGKGEIAASAEPFVMSTPGSVTDGPVERWQLADLPGGIRWNVSEDTRLPHADHVEMSGRKVSVIARYAVDAERNLSLTRDVIWPALRLTEGDVRGYLRRQYADDFSPTFAVDGQTMHSGSLDSVTISGGVLRFVFKPLTDLEITRTLFPSRTHSVVLENWTVTNSGEAPIQIMASFRRPRTK
jgi:hypothetical protein